MSEIIENTRGSLNPLDGARTLKFKFDHWREEPTYFYPDGIWIFTGAQGSGKTLSAVQCLQTMHKRYPLAKVCSNMTVHGVDDVIPFERYEQLSELDNGVEGVIFLIDEIHVLWNSLESRDIPITEMAVFCQMRKARRIIIGTSQVYNRIAKPIREQLKYVIQCQNFFNCFQYNIVCDPSLSVEDSSGHIQPEVIKRQFWFHRPELYEAYETLSKIDKIQRTRSLIPKDLESKPWKVSPSPSSNRSWKLPSQ